MSHIQLASGHQSVAPSTKPICSPRISEGGQTCIQVFFFRAGQNWGNRPYFPRHDRELSLAEVLESFVGQFYDERDRAEADPAIAKTLPELRTAGGSAVAARRTQVEIAVPQRGEKRDIMRDGAAPTRANSSRRRMAENSRSANCWKAWRKCSAWNTPPRRIEVYDNSHIQGTQCARRHDRRGTGRLRERRVPQIQHQARPISRPATITP